MDTAYSRAWIHDTIDKETNKAVRYLLINRMGSSGIFLDQNELLAEYTKYYHLVRYFNPNFKKTLMLGGAGYAYPSDFLVKYPQSSIDVVEIDPGITELARKYFRLKDNTRLNIYHQDARVYLNKNKKKYDAIFGDAFGSYHSIPYQLTTKEVVLEKYNNLSDDGVVILNIIGSISGEKGKFLRAEYTTYKNIFSQVYLFPVQNPENGDVLQNVMLIALKSNKVPSFSSDDNDLNQYLGHLWKEPIPNDMPILTDDYAPVDYYTYKAD